MTWQVWTKLFQLEWLNYENLLRRAVFPSDSQKYFQINKNRNCVLKKMLDIAFVAYQSVLLCNAFFLFFSFRFRRTSRIPLYEFGPVEAVIIGSVDLALLLTFAFWQQKYLMILIISWFFLLWNHLGLNFILKQWRFSSTGWSCILCGKILCKPLCIVLPMHLVLTCSVPYSPLSVSLWAQKTKDPIWYDS